MKGEGCEGLGNVRGALWGVQWLVPDQLALAYRAPCSCKYIASFLKLLAATTAPLQTMNNAKVSCSPLE